MIRRLGQGAGSRVRIHPPATDSAKVGQPSADRGYLRVMPTDYWRALEGIGERYGISADAICGPSQSTRCCAARREAVRLLRRAGYSAAQVGLWMGRSKQGIIGLKRPVNIARGLWDRDAPDLSGEWAI